MHISYYGASGIYTIRNNVTGRMYIGQAISLYDRRDSHFAALRGGYWGNHRCYQKSEKELQLDWNTYGESNFSFIVLDDLSSFRNFIFPYPVKDIISGEIISQYQDLLDSRERYWVQYYGSTDPNRGYNKLEGGKSGFHHTEETKSVLRDKNSGENSYWYGRPKSKESIAKRVVTITGKYRGENSWNYGKHRSEESKVKQSSSRIGKYAGSNHPGATPVMCVSRQLVFPYIKLAAQWAIGGSSGNIINCCKGKVRTAGRDPETNEQLVWTKDIPDYILNDPSHWYNT